MARTGFTYTCGHDGVAHGSSRKDADGRASYFANDPCWECKKEAENVRSREAAQAGGLPELQGTPKQVAYGNTCRHIALPGLDQALASLRGRLKADLAATVRLAMLDALILLEDEVRGNTAARFWIENQMAHDQWKAWLLDQVRARNLVPEPADEEV